MCLDSVLGVGGVLGAPQCRTPCGAPCGCSPLEPSRATRGTRGTRGTRDIVSTCESYWSGLESPLEQSGARSPTIRKIPSENLTAAGVTPQPKPSPPKAGYPPLSPISLTSTRGRGPRGRVTRGRGPRGRGTRGRDTRTPQPSSNHPNTLSAATSHALLTSTPKRIIAS